MDATYAGSYGKLRALKSDFLKDAQMQQLMLKDTNDFITYLSDTKYRTEIDMFSGKYIMPDLQEAVINMHMMNNIKHALSMMPLTAKDFMNAYTARWDIENIKVLLSSKILGYELKEAESFLVLGDKPIGAIVSKISKEDYINMFSKPDVEEIINYLVKYKYGSILLEHIDEIKNKGELSSVILALDTYYYTNMFNALRFFNSNRGFRFYTGTKWVIERFIRESIDVKNIMAIIKAKVLNYSFDDIKDNLIPNGKISISKLSDMSKKNIEDMQSDMPFKIDSAFEYYKKDPLMAYFEASLKKALYKKHIEALNTIPISLHTILSFMLQSEMERDVLRATWYAKYYDINRERAEHAMIMKF